MATVARLKYKNMEGKTFDEFIEQAGGVDTMEAREVGNIYMAYEDGDSDIYSYLPIEAQLFEAQES